MLSSSLLLLATAALSQTVAAWQVELPYHVTSVPVENYTNSSGKILTKPLLAYFSIPYASPPLGKLRFEYPVAPKPGKKVILNNTDYGLVCSQPIGNPPLPQGEDCLTLSVFRPQNASYSTKLPVVVWTPGGSFNTGGGRGLNVPSMVGNAPQDFIGVSINYRLGAFGFLPSSLTHRAGLLNIGLMDQKMAYEWVQQYIELFGGDPNRVTVRTLFANR
jgi:acetylcholinesterase